MIAKSGIYVARRSIVTCSGAVRSIWAGICKGKLEIATCFRETVKSIFCLREARYDFRGWAPDLDERELKGGFKGAQMG